MQFSLPVNENRKYILMIFSASVLFYLDRLSDYFIIEKENILISNRIFKQGQT